MWREQKLLTSVPRRQCVSSRACWSTTAVRWQWREPWQDFGKQTEQEHKKPVSPDIPVRGYLCYTNNDSEPYGVAVLPIGSESLL